MDLKLISKIKNMQKKIFIIVLSFFLCSFVLGTPQMPDNIFYKGKKYCLLHNFPMDSYFKKYPEKHPRKDFYISTALKRGYLATFEIKENQLYVKDIESRIQGTKIDEKGKVVPNFKSVMNEVFPNKKLVKINWVTGLFVLPVEKANLNVAYGDYPIYENYIILEIEKGILIREKELTHEEYVTFKKKQFEAFKKTEEYEKLITTFLKKSWTVEEIDKNVEYMIIEYSTRFLVD